MWPVVLGALRNYAPYLVFPCAFVIGSVGYIFETRLRTSPGGQQERSTLESRQDRQLVWIDEDDPTNTRKLSRDELPTTVFDRQEKAKWKLL